MELPVRSAYLAAPELETPLQEELARKGVRVQAWHGVLALSPDPPVDAVWAACIWLDPVELPAPSVKAAADALRGIQRNWAAYAADLHRRMELIGERLPPVAAKPLAPGTAPPASHLGAWTLLAPDRLLASPHTSSPVPNGEWRFVEDRAGPPSRAYLKLWEAFARLRAWPKPGETCLDLGASPGGWTWAVAGLGAAVTAVDRAELAPEVTRLPGVTFRQGNAFAEPVVPVDWLVCDVIAYPARSLELVQRWMAPGGAARIVCTVKFQGATDHAMAEAFAAIPEGRLWHLWHNKHELTFAWARPG
jgi:23S rRNA (cytidine2498-2'-O)-methyltransferase